MKKNKIKYDIQVSKDHYDFEKYVELERWISYFYQIDQVRNISRIAGKKHLSILEIGPGDGIVTEVLRKKGMKVTTLDLDPELKPDYVSTLPDLGKVKNKKFDLIICCEVLEHMEYKDMEIALKNLSEIGKYFIFSVPHVSVSLATTFKFVYFKTLKYLLAFDLNFRKIKFNGQHYWEIGYKGSSYKIFRKSLLNAGFKFLNDFRISEHPYHHFFILEKK